MKKSILWGILASLASGVAEAHPGHGLTAGFAAGFMHPFTGWDHLLVMLSLGIWAARRPQGQGWPLPLLFVLVMTLSALTAMAWLSASFAEVMVAASVLIMGALLLSEVSVSRTLQWAGVTVIAAAHGYLHGLELGSHWAALVGMVTATAMLHVAGWLMGHLRQSWATHASRLLGALMLLLGIGLIWA